jgi:hypothetical protein
VPLNQERERVRDRETNYWIAKNKIANWPEGLQIWLHTTGSSILPRHVGHFVQKLGLSFLHSLFSRWPMQSEYLQSNFCCKAQQELVSWSRIILVKLEPQPNVVRISKSRVAQMLNVYVHLFQRRMSSNCNIVHFSLSFRDSVASRPKFLQNMSFKTGHRKKNIFAEENWPITVRKTFLCEKLSL